MRLDEQDSIVLISTLTLQRTIIDLPNKSYVDSRVNDPSIIRKIAHVDFNDKNLDDVSFVTVDSLPAVREHLTPKFYVDQANNFSVLESSLLRLDPDEKLKLYEQDSIIINSSLTSPKTIIELPTKSYVDSLHENRRKRRDLSTVFNDQDNEIDNNNLANLDSVTINRIFSSDNEVSARKYVEDSVGECTLLRFNQTLQNFNLTKYDKIQITDTTIFKYPNNGGYLLQNWVIKCNDKKIAGKVQNLIRSTKTNNPARVSGATSLPPIGDSFMYLETSSNNRGDIVFCSWEGTDIIQIGNIFFLL